MINILFYKYVELENLNKLRKKFIENCENFNILGTIILAKEGINGCITGEIKNIQKFKNFLKKDIKFSNIIFKSGITDSHSFKKLKVKIKKEIVTSRLDVDIKKAGKFIEAKELKKLFDSNEDFIMVDMRNSYESNIGNFDNSILLNIENFRDLHNNINQINGMKNKKIVAYCTGGVRCEKGSAFLIKKGFKNVQQLKDGILNYGKIVGNNHWNGKCFVFDNRVFVDIDPKNQNQLISECFLCNIKSADYNNCKISKCDKRFISCKKCLEKLKGCCSEKCFENI